MAKYVDGFVLVVPKDKTEEYKKMAEGGRDIWMNIMSVVATILNHRKWEVKKLVCLQKWLERIVMR